VLQVISRFPGDLQPVFEAVLANATGICDAKFGLLWLTDRGGFRCVALHNVPPAFADYYRSQLMIHPAPGTGLRRLADTRRVAQVPDMTKIQPYIERDPFVVTSVELGSYRSVVNVPMLEDEELIGAISIYRQEVGTFTETQIELVSNFASQAVIAIENARLLNELRESLQEQTATSEVLQVISSSPGDLEPVFAAMLKKAVGICDAKFGNIYRWDGEALHVIATHNTPQAFVEGLRRVPYRPNPKAPIGQMVATKAVVHVADVMADTAYIEQTDPMALAAVALGHTRTALAVPLLNEGEVIGAFVLSRQEVRPFTDRQIALVTNFAAQAVIAIENARLLTELRQRTADLTERTTDLTEALEQQTATSDVLKAISGSPGDLHGVFETMLANATRLCEATHGHVWSFDGEQLHAVAVRGDEQFVKWLREHNPVRLLVGSSAERIVKGEPIVHVADRRDEPAYRSNHTFRELVDSSGIRASLSVALCKGETLLGMINVYRKEVRPFSEKQIDLVKNFAAQAVIAIENARLLNELRQRTEEVEKLNQHLEQRVTDQVDEIERMGRLRRFLPPQVADLIVASGNERQLESHRREITALFCACAASLAFLKAPTQKM
jgi:GAF domain-containing protein